MSPDPLESVRRANVTVRRAESNLRAALASVPSDRYAELGRLLGVSRQAARQAVERAKRSPSG